MDPSHTQSQWGTLPCSRRLQPAQAIAGVFVQPHRQELPGVVPRKQRLVHDVPCLQYAQLLREIHDQWVWFVMHMLIRLGMHVERLQNVRQVVKGLTRMAGSSLYSRPVTVLLRITILRIYALIPALCIRKGFQKLALYGVTCTRLQQKRRQTPQ